MGFSVLLLLILLSVAIGLTMIGAVLHRKYKQRRPSLLSVATLILQLLLFVLFFSDTTEYNERLFETIWWVVVISGLIVGAIKIKHNVIISLINIFISGLLGVLMLLLMFITSM
ncbi:hypothetical protein F6Y05_38420 [Bacillus megaterium]|nr:hypothetical protein [Priestia megaterium]